MRISPPGSGSSKPASSRSVVVLPHPEGPRREKNSPRRTSKDTPSTAFTGAERAPKLLLTRVNWTMGGRDKLGETSWVVGSGQWAVGSGQWAVGGGPAENVCLAAGRRKASGPLSGRRTVSGLGSGREASHAETRGAGPSRRGHSGPASGAALAGAALGRRREPARPARGGAGGGASAFRGADGAGDRAGGRDPSPDRHARRGGRGGACLRGSPARRAASRRREAGPAERPRRARRAGPVGGREAVRGAGPGRPRRHPRHRGREGGRRRLSRGRLPQAQGGDRVRLPHREADRHHDQHHADHSRPLRRLRPDFRRHAIMSQATEFDAIVVGSGMSGGWAAKELCERGLRTLVLEAGRDINPLTDYVEHVQPWEVRFRGWGDGKALERDQPIQKNCYACDEWSGKFFVNDRENPYEFDADKPFHWIRGRHVGGRSLMWGRQVYRWSDLDFEANLKDGIAVDWPIRYADLAPWYDHVERFIGISGQAEHPPP